MSASINFGGDAAKKVWALVAGLPSTKRASKPLLMLQAYIDESHNKGVFVMAGFISTVEKWAAMSDEWESLLRLRSPHYRILDEVHMHELVHSEASLEQASWFYKLAMKYAQAGIVCSINVAELERAAREFPYSEAMGGVRTLRQPYLHAFRYINLALVRYKRDLGIEGPVDFVFDDHSSMALCLEGWNHMRWFARPELLAELGETPAFRNSKTTYPLQAADMFAYWVRERLTKGRSFPWELDTDLRVLRVDEKTANEFKEEWEESVIRHVMRREGYIDRWGYPTPFDG